MPCNLLVNRKNMKKRILQKATPAVRVEPSEVTITTTATTPLAVWTKHVTSFIDVLDVKPSSVELYQRTLRIFFEWVVGKGKNLADLTRSDVLEYRADLYEKGLSALTIASYLTSLRKFYQWATGEGLVERDITLNVKTPKRVQAFKKMHLTEEKSTELLTHFQNVGLRDYAIVNLLLRTGLRTIEVARADVGDVTYIANKRVLKVWGKGHDTKDDFVVLTEKAYQPIKEYLATRKGVKPNEPLFAGDGNRNVGGRLTTHTISRLCKSGLRAIGLDGREFSAHSLRHTSGVLVLNHGGDINDAQRLLRHASTDTTQIYVESIKRELRLRESPEEIIDKAI